MKNIALAFLLATVAFPVTTIAVEPTDWLSPESEIQLFPVAVPDTPPTSWYEVRVTKLMQAVQELEKLPAVALGVARARLFVGPHYVSEPGKDPYLVRGLFNNNYSGHHSVAFRDSMLLIHHSSFGKIVKIEFSPLVVNLPSAPTRVIVRVIAR